MRKGLFTGVFLALLLSLFAVCAIAQGIQNIQVHGYAQNRLYENPDSSGRFQVFRVSLSAVGQVGNTGTVYLETYIHPWLSGASNQEIYTESAYVDLPFLSGRIRVGKGRGLNFGMTPTYPNRKLTEYSILEEVFTQSRITGAQYAYNKGILDVGASVYTDLRAETTTIGGQPGFNSSSLNGVAHIINRDDNAFGASTSNGTVEGTTNGPSGNMAESLKVGIATPCLRFHVSGMVGHLTAADANSIMGFFKSPTGAPLPGSSLTHNAYGADASYTFGKFCGVGEAYTGKFSDLKISGWSLLAGYEPKNKTRVYARYSALNNNMGPNNGALTTSITAQQATWAPRQLTIGIVQPIRQSVWAELEYEKNTEDTGGAAKVNNDLLFLEFFCGF